MKIRIGIVFFYWWCTLCKEWGIVRKKRIIIRVIGLIKINKGRNRKGNRFGNCNNSVRDDNSGENFGPPAGGAGTLLRAVPSPRG